MYLYVFDSMFLSISHLILKNYSALKDKRMRKVSLVEGQKTIKLMANFIRRRDISLPLEKKTKELNECLNYESMNEHTRKRSRAERIRFCFDSFIQSDERSKSKWKFLAIEFRKFRIDLIKLNQLFYFSLRNGKKSPLNRENLNLTW